MASTPRRSLPQHDRAPGSSPRAKGSSDLTAERSPAPDEGQSDAGDHRPPAVSARQRRQRQQRRWGKGTQPAQRALIAVSGAAAAVPLAERVCPAVAAPSAGTVAAPGSAGTVLRTRTREAGIVPRPRIVSATISACPSCPGAIRSPDDTAEWQAGQTAGAGGEEWSADLAVVQGPRVVL